MADFGIITFQIADIQFGVFSEQIVEIVRLDDFRQIPMPLPYVVGLTELRNYIVTIVDFRKRLGLSRLSYKPGTTMIAIKLSSGVFGLLVESISNFTRVPEERILSPFSIAGLPAQLLQGVLAANEEILILPDLEKIFSSYIPMQLLSITTSEKIAFQYRATPGAISRTLENTLISQGYLDEDIILKLPRSMNLPSVQVHKFISYYPDFKPRTNVRGEEEAAGGTHQQARAGDESYSSLSKRLESRLQPTYSRPVQQTQQLPELPFSRQHDVSHAFEMILQSSVGEEGTGLSPQRLLSERELGRHVAKTLRIATVRTWKYFSYYSQSSTTGIEYPSPRQFFERLQRDRHHADQRPNLDHRLNELLHHSRHSLADVMHQLMCDGYVLGRKALRRIGEHYQASQITIARLAGNFPELQLDFAEEQEETRRTAEGENRSQVQSPSLPEEKEQAPNSEKYQHLMPHIRRLRSETANLNVCLQYLADRDVLHDDRAVRDAAAQLRVASCRLYKLRSYYQFSER